MALFVPPEFSGARFPTEVPWPDSITLDFGIRQSRHQICLWFCMAVGPGEVAIPCVGLCQ